MPYSYDRRASDPKTDFWAQIHAELKSRWPQYARPKTIGGPTRGRGFNLYWKEGPGVELDTAIFERGGRVWIEVEDQKLTDPKKAAQAIADSLDVRWEESRWDD